MPNTLGAMQLCVSKSVTFQAMTSGSEKEIIRCLELLKVSSAGSGFMHESFWKDDAAYFTRPWFAWANTLFGQLILELAQSRPELIFRLDENYPPS